MAGSGMQGMPAAFSSVIAEGREFEEGTFFVLGFDSTRDKYILQHDTNHCGDLLDDRLMSTYTEIGFPPLKRDGVGWVPVTYLGEQGFLPPPRWLRGRLLDLTARFQPNHFSLT